MSQSLSTALWNYDVPQMSATLDGAENITELVGAVVFSDEDEVQTSFGQFANTGDEEKSTREIEIEQYKLKEYTYDSSAVSPVLYEYNLPLIYYDVTDDSQHSVGYVMLYSSREKVIDEVKYKFFVIIVNAGIKTIALWFIFLYFTKKVVSRPLNELTDATRRLNPDLNNKSDNEVPHSLLERSNRGDEISTLIGHFVGMRESINSKISMIENQNATLEQRVKERTCEVESVNKRLLHLTLVDNLTSLANRNAFAQKFDEAVKQPDSNFAVACIDMEKFKAINDSFGHDAGDAALVEVASRLQHILRDSDVVARLGGDEFALILKDVDEDHALKKARKICDHVNRPSTFKNSALNIRINMGLALYPFHGVTTEELYKHADVAMYDAKSNSQSFMIYSKSMHERHRRREIVSSQLKKAIEHDEFTLCYQPIVSAADGTVHSFEALLRWNNTVLGVVSPEEFIPVAEASGRMIEITDWVIRNATQEFGENAPDSNLSINISAAQTTDSSFPSRALDLVRDSGISVEHITLELTESAMLGEEQQALGVLNELKEIGFRLSIDDFGTGYSSFSYLTKLPLDELKIDRSFLSDRDNSDNLRNSNQMVIEAIVGLSHKLGLRTVVEGVENQALYDQMKKLDVDLLQGYLFTEPMSVSELSAWWIDPPCQVTKRRA